MAGTIWSSEEGGEGELWSAHGRKKKGKKEIFHINILRKWYVPTDNAYLTQEVTKEEGDDVVLWKEEEDQDLSGPTIGSDLPEAQKEELGELLKEFKGTLQNEPGRTSLIEHRIEVGGTRPTRLPPYRLPHAYRDQVQEELREMEASGVIEPSNSEWAFPIVMVKKNDGSLRFCVDYCRLNSVATTDAYPMPRVDELIDRLGNTKFITTLDLTRGYWQVPM